MATKSQKFFIDVFIYLYIYISIFFLLLNTSKQIQNILWLKEKTPRKLIAQTFSQWINFSSFLNSLGSQLKKHTNSSIFFILIFVSVLVTSGRREGIVEACMWQIVRYFLYAFNCV